MNPKVTVLMSVYNGEQYLQEAIESVLNQTYLDFEFLIINDASTDKSKEIILLFNDNRIKLIENEQNLGLTKSLNKGLNIAAGKYVARMDADDISLPERLEKQVKFMDENPKFGICGSWVKTIGVNGKKGKIWSYPVNNQEIQASLLFNNTFVHSSVIIRKDFFDKYQLFYNENIKYSQDYDLWTRASQYFNVRNITEVLVLFRRHKSSIGKVYSNEQTGFADNIRLNILNNFREDFSNHDLSIHQAISNKRYEFNDSFLTDTESWLVKLLKINSNDKIYGEEIFKKILADKWYEICKNIAKSGLNNREVYLDSKLSKYKCLTLKEKFWLYIIPTLGFFDYYKVKKETGFVR